MEKTIDTLESFIFELILLMTGISFVGFGYHLAYELYNYIGIGFMIFGMLLSYFNKKAILDKTNKRGISS
jgi:hypothetical protein